MPLFQFYLYAMLAACWFLGCILFFLSYRSQSDKPFNKGALFLSLVYFCWFMMALFKLANPGEPSLFYAVSDRVFSSFVNLFLLSSVLYFPFTFRIFGRVLSLESKADGWATVLGIFFVVLTISFIALERAFNNDYVRISVVWIDTVISLVSVCATSAALLYGVHGIWKNKPILFILTVGLALYCSSQLVLPLTLLYPAVFVHFYGVGLVSVFLGIILIGVLGAAYFTHIKTTEQEIDGSYMMQTVSPATEKIKDTRVPVRLTIGYDEIKKVYLLSVTFSGPGGEVTDTLFAKKVLKPFANWVVFAAAGMVSAKLEHEDMAMIKYRMVDYWNKQGSSILSQDSLFHGDGGKFELLISSQNIHINQGDFLFSRFTILESMKDLGKSFSEEQIEMLKNRLSISANL